MLVDVYLHSAPAALHYFLGSGSAASVPVTNASQVQSVLSPTSGSIAIGP